MQKPKTKPKDPFFGLKYVAYIRTGLPVNAEDMDGEAFLNFAKWQICKARGILWLDPIWESYTAQETLVEYFSIRFDESEDLRKEFEAGLTQPKKSDLDWFESRQKRLLADKAREAGIIKGGNTPEQPDPVKEPEEFEDTFK